MTSLNPAFIQKFYREATELLHSSRHYMLHQGKFEMETLTKHHGQYIEQEMARVATRMSEIVTWLLEIRRSGTPVTLHRDPIAPCLKDHWVCIVDSTLSPPYPLPEKLFKLLQETRNLYMRLMRLEDLLIKRQKKGARPISPTPF